MLEIRLNASLLAYVSGTIDLRVFEENTGWWGSYSNPKSVSSFLLNSHPSVSLVLEFSSRVSMKAASPTCNTILDA